MNKNKPRRRSTSAAIYISVSALLVIILTAFGTSVFLKIMHIEVDGASVYTEEEIVAASGISSGNNLLFISAGAVSERICTAMPYIKEIKITRLLPDAIRIDVSESSAIASVSYSDEILLIDSEARVLQSVGLDNTDTVPHGLIEVLGFAPDNPETGRVLRTALGDETRLQYLTDVLAAIESTGLHREISYIDIANIANITIGYTERFRVILGSAADVSQKLRRLPRSIEVINETCSDEETGVIDMSDTVGEWRFNPD